MDFDSGFFTGTVPGLVSLDGVSALFPDFSLNATDNSSSLVVKDAKSSVPCSRSSTISHQILPPEVENKHHFSR